MRRLLLTLLLALLLITTVSAATVTVTDANIQMGTSSTANIILTGADTGLSGYSIPATVTGGHAKISGVSFPGWALLHSTSPLPAESVTISAADLNNAVTGPSVVLATLTISRVSDGDGTITITVISMDDDTGQPISPTTVSGTYTVSPGRPRSTETIAPLDDSGYDLLFGAIGGDSQLNDTTEGVDWLDIKSAVEQPYTSAIGSLFFAIVFAIPFLMQWIRQGSMVIPGALGTILGGFMLAQTPAEYHIVAYAFIALGILGIVWGIYKERI
jgi:hypothetical protein